MSIIMSTDSYKQTHWKMYPPDTEVVYSYFESRPGAKWESTLFFGLQHILKERLLGRVVTSEDLLGASEIAATHFGDKGTFNHQGWLHVVKDHGGRLPIRIKAVPEGTVVPVGNVLMTVENTCPQCFWMTNYVESLLTHVWYPSTVATLSLSVKEMLAGFLERTSDNPGAVDFMLHDFGYRGASSEETAAIGGAAHLVNFMGTDTLPAMSLLLASYAADLESLAFSVPATEHSVMTARGREGEYEVLDQLLEQYPSGILSVVADSFDIYAFTDQVIRRKDEILAREGRFVLRPDSVTGGHSTPEALSVALVQKLWDGFGGEVNSKGFKVLHDQVRVLWGDGIDPAGIGLILGYLEVNGFSVENMVFGMGGGLLQKVNRDTQRFAFKSSAQKRSGVWHDVQKQPLDTSKTSKAGRLKLIATSDGYETVRLEAPGDDVLQTVFEDGKLLVDQTLTQVRSRV